MENALPSLSEKIFEIIEDQKGLDIKVVDVRGKSSVCDYIVIASGTSSRHVRGISEVIQRKLKEFKFRPLSVEGTETSEWILMDYDSVIVHLFKPETRELYKLEDMWEIDLPHRNSHAT